MGKLEKESGWGDGDLSGNPILCGWDLSRVLKNGEDFHAWRGNNTSSERSSSGKGLAVQGRALSLWLERRRVGRKVVGEGLAGTDVPELDRKSVYFFASILLLWKSALHQLIYPWPFMEHLLCTWHSWRPGEIAVDNIGKVPALL